MSPFMTYPTTGYWPATDSPCIRCGVYHLKPLYLLCQDCRDADLILADAARIVAERELDLWGDNPDGYETPMQIRASLGH
jgi:hypothetical protein